MERLSVVQVVIPLTLLGIEVLCGGTESVLEHVPSCCQFCVVLCEKVFNENNRYRWKGRGWNLNFLTSSS